MFYQPECRCNNLEVPTPPAGSGRDRHNRLRRRSRGRTRSTSPRSDPWARPSPAKRGVQAAGFCAETQCLSQILASLPHVQCSFLATHASPIRCCRDANMVWRLHRAVFSERRRQPTSPVPVATLRNCMAANMTKLWYARFPRGAADARCALNAVRWPPASGATRAAGACRCGAQPGAGAGPPAAPEAAIVMATAPAV